jgi:hypothetical protein
MRTLLVLILAACGTITPSWGQQTPVGSGSRAELLAQLRSEDAGLRSNAFERLRGDPAALRDSQVKAALVSLLDRENKEPVYGEEEDFAEYTSSLADTVAKLANWSDPHQVCILANSVDLPDELADHAKIAIPCLLQRLRNGLNRYAPGPDISRGDVVAMLIQALAKGKSDLEDRTIETVRHIILNALRDPDDGVRIDTVKALGSFGEKDMIPALEDVAEHDPGPDVHGHSIRKWAAQAITEIQKRAGEK